MRKLSIFLLGASLTFAVGVFSPIGKTQQITASAEGKVVYVGGMSAGFTLKTGGAQIIGNCDVMTENGIKAPAAKAGLRVGDLIVKAGGIKVDSLGQLNEIVDKNGEKALHLEVLRGEESFTVTLNPVKDKVTDRYKIGVLVRDNVSGIGTITYIDKEKRCFGALGHAVLGENNREMQIYDGMVYECSIVGVAKGVRGKAGELRGMFLSDKKLGNAEKLCSCGIFGRLDGEFNTKGLQYVVASSEYVHPGEAYIYSTINGVSPKKYEIEIVKVDKRKGENKNYVIKVVDEELIAETGGIVQGMSGSPILQDDKMVGAVTHVFLNDPTRGYGIDINQMIIE